MNNTQIQQKLFTAIPKPLFATLIFACFARIIVALAVVNFRTDFYWEYGEIAKNIIAGHGYSLYYISYHDLAYHFIADGTPFPSALMAPGYVGFLLPLMMMTDVLLRNIFIVFIQTVLSLLTILLIYKFTAKYFSERAALISCLVVSILPDFVYSVVSFTPTVFYHVAVTALLLVLYNKETNTTPQIIQLSVVFVFLSYLRWEFILFVMLYLLLQICSHKWKNTGIVIVVMIALLVPWSIRNYHVFGQFVPLSTGFGLNFYRGNNPEEIGSWGDEKLKKDILTLPQDRTFEVHLDRLYRQRAFDFIQSYPWKELSNIPPKLYHLWVFSPLQQRSNDSFYHFFSICFFVFSSIGFLTTFSWQRHKYIYLLLFSSTIIGLVFFTLPRHQTMMKIVLIPFSGAGVEFLWDLLKRKGEILKSKRSKQQST